VDVWATGLEIPWSIDWLDPRRALVTERPGRLRLVEDGKMHPQPIANTPQVLHEGQGGLLDVAVDPNHSENGWVYLAYSHALETEPGGRPGAMTRIVRGRIRDHAWVDQQVLYEAPHETYRTTRHHYGCRIVFDPQGYLYFGIGDRGVDRDAQDLSRPNGKIHRIHRDGSIPKDNPFVGREGVLPTIYSYGHRNPQGLAVHPQTGRVWETEHGPMGGDELNLISPGLNYGWPVVTYGLNYDGTVISPLRRKPGMEVPNLYWTPSPALCGLDFYRGDLFAKWNDRLLVGALRYEQVELLDIEQDRVIHQETILKNAGRVRDVACGPDGAIYVVLNRPDIILRLTPSGEKLP
jgi:aldose sugar dehydrogenase